MAKTTTTQNQTQSQTTSGTTTRLNPDWLSGGVEGLAGQIGLLGQMDPQTFVPGASGLQQQAFGQGGLLGGANPFYGSANAAIGTANSATTPQVSASTIDPTKTFSGSTAYGGISNYFNPYEDKAVRSALDDIGYQGQIADQYAKSRATSNGAWGGDGEAVLRGITGDNFTRQMGSTAASMRNQGFQTALGASQADADRQQQAAAQNAAAENARAQSQAALAQQASTTNAGLHNDVINRYLTSAGLLGGLGQQWSSDNRADLGLLGDLGGQQRDIMGQQAQAPLGLLNSQVSMFGGLPSNLFSGEQSDGTMNGTMEGTGTSKTKAGLFDWASMFASNAASAAKAFA